jgi:hydrogenase expression/formation protein HypD
MMSGKGFRDPERVASAIRAIKEIGMDISVMHVCGTHQDTLVRFGLEPLLKEAGISIRQGPGCPVCVTTPEEVEMAIALSRKGAMIATFGDMLKVRGRDASLDQERAEGADVRIVYSPTDAVGIAQENPGREVVLLGIGFETTAPTTSALLLRDDLPENLSVLSFHRTVPEALRFIAERGEIKLDGIIEPGHVSMVIGEAPYRFLSDEFHMPQVISGFEPLDLVMACLEIARMRSEGRSELVNMYGRTVHAEGNIIAQRAMGRTFVKGDRRWRGFPAIPGSALCIAPEFEGRDASKRFEDDLEDLKGLELPEPPGCRCGEVLRGLIDPRECPLFGGACNPDDPVGPCMVSREGSCNILCRWGPSDL